MALRFGIVGCGHIAQRHALNISRVGKLAAVYDIKPGKAAALGAPYQAMVSDSFEDLLDQKPDVVSICTPNYLHASQAIQAMEAGSDVLCEKPMAISVSDGLKMAAVSKTTGRKLFIVKQNRFNPPVAFCKRLLDEGGLGPVHSFQVNCFWNRPAAYYQSSDWKGKPNLDGGILFTQFSHFIDLIYWFFGQLVNVSARGAAFLLEKQLAGEDTGIAILEMENGSIGSLHYTVTAHGKNMEGSLAVFGEKGSLRIGGQYLNELTWFDVQDRIPPLLSASAAPNDYGSYQGSMSNHAIVYDELIKALENSPHRLPSPADALHSIAIIEKIQSSLAR